MLAASLMITTPKETIINVMIIPRRAGPREGGFTKFGGNPFGFASIGILLISVDIFVAPEQYTQEIRTKR